MWILGGSLDATHYYNSVWYSTDGSTWTQANASAAWPGRYGHASCVFDNKMWVMGGYGGTGQYNDVWYSTDGSTWTQATAGAGWSARSFPACTVFDNKMWIMGGQFGASHYNDVWYSTDGSTWTQANASVAWTTRYAFSSLVFNNKMWVIGGADNGGATLKNDTWYSSDGNIWKQANASSAWTSRYFHSGSVFDDKMWVVGGFDTRYKNDTWYSSDGNVWTQANASAAWSGREIHSSCVFDNKIWVLGGKETSGVVINDVWHSDLASALPPTVTSITPATGENTGSIMISNLAGTGFANGAAVNLTKTGQANISATGISVDSATKITGNFNLNGAAAGSWDVIVTNSDGQSGTLSNGFTITNRTTNSNTATSYISSDSDSLKNVQTPLDLQNSPVSNVMVNVGGDSAIHTIDIMGRGIDDVVVTAFKVDSLPESIPPPDIPVYQYIKMTPASFTEIENTYATFNVHKSLISENGYERTDVVMLHYVIYSPRDRTDRNSPIIVEEHHECISCTGAWVRLPTWISNAPFQYDTGKSHKSSDPTYKTDVLYVIDEQEYTYTTNIPSFSYFAIGFVKNGTIINETYKNNENFTPPQTPTMTTPLPKTVVTAPQLLQQSPPTKTQNTSLSIDASPGNKIPFTTIVVGVTGIIVIILGLLIIRKWWYRRQNPTLFKDTSFFR